MLDDILDLFGRRKRQHDAENAPSARKSGLPFDLPFLDDENEEEARDRRRHEYDRGSAPRPAADRGPRAGDWF